MTTPADTSPLNLSRGRHTRKQGNTNISRLAFTALVLFLSLTVVSASTPAPATLSIKSEAAADMAREARSGKSPIRSPKRSPRAASPRRKAPLLQAASGNGDIESPGKKGKKELAPTGLKGDWGSIALLLLLYTLQGIPMGLGGSLPMLFVERKVSTAALAQFSMVAYPFAFKLLWAPLVDSVYSSRFGRRKTWIVPAQAAIGMLLLVSSGQMDALLGPVGGGEVNVARLTALFFTFYFLAATQDIAVDGLALTILSPRNRELGATCNAIGQTLGFFLAYVGFLALQHYGLVTLGGFMQFWGWVFLASTIWVVSVRKDEHEAQPGSLGDQLLSAYREMLSVLQLSTVRSFALVLLTCKAGLAAFDALVPLELQKSGVPKEALAGLSTFMMPVSMIAQAYVSRWTTGESSRPLKLWLGAFQWRLAVGALLVMLVKGIHLTTAGGANAIPMWIYALGALASGLSAVVSAVMFVAQMAFFNQVSDPKIGGTYMTMLNTLSNLGGQWPGTVVLATKAAVEKLMPGGDSFTVVTVCSLGIGIAWLAMMSKRINEIQDKPKTSWHTRPALVKPVKG